MSLTMNREEREAFLMGLHVGVISIEQEGAPPLSVPIWYDYRPGVGVWIITGEESAKGRALLAAGRFTLVAQEEAPPAYKYVSVEGPVSETRAADRESDTRPMAHRYFGKELGDAYIAGQSEGDSSLVFVMQPERWRTVDYARLGSL
ncbi:MAG: pyridoxamine 5'-phosphate oxidase family protein [Myxococcota bacterium]|jgi:nitroimidazol reductase NimA-like FMN-containing flavoprotein (pyridoxamine 5'-phosphate oxidase superfamily)|nr:pyridoxamine 5'-phosphate oxidase family protein [Myxococcota bacterium]